MMLTKENICQIVERSYKDPITDNKRPPVHTTGYKYEYPKGSVKCGTLAVLGKRASDSSSLKLDNKRPCGLQSHFQGISFNEERPNSPCPQSTPQKVNHSPNGSLPSISPIGVGPRANNESTIDRYDCFGDVQDIFNEVTKGNALEQEALDTNLFGYVC